MVSRRQSTTVAELKLLVDDLPLLDIRGAADRLGCSERFIRRLVQERRIPFIKLAGTRVRFCQSDIDHWISAQRIETTR